MLRSKVSMTFLLCYIVQVYGEWQLYDAWLIYNSKFIQNSSYDSYYINSGGFIMPFNYYTTANFINCQSPSTSYITLNYTYITAISIYSRSFYNSPFYLSIDLYFTGTWNGNFIFQIGGYSQTYYYNSASGIYSYSEFCDSQSYQVKTLNFQINGNVEANYFLSISNSNPSGAVSLRNLVVSRPKCYSPSCVYCLGTEYNQCTYCYYGNPTNGICPTCSGTTPYNMKGSGCKPACGLYALKYQDGYCQNFPQWTFASTYFSYYYYMQSTYYAQFVKKYSVIQDVDHIDSNIVFQSDSTYGVFRYKNAIFRQISEITPYNDQGSILIYITLKLTGTMPNNCGIQFKLNNSYYGSIYMNSNGMQYNNVRLYEQYSAQYSVYMMLDIPQYPFGFLIVSNDTTGNFGWSLSNFGVTSGVCPSLCQLCEIPYICKSCKTGYFLYRDGTCLGVCNQFYQTIVNTTYCQDFDDMTLYSKYLVQEYISLEGDPNQQSKYQLVSSSGTNFLKGPNIYYSFWQSNRVFGGPYVWAKAKFKRVFPITSPHHSVTIAFLAIFGPQFSGVLIYTSDSNPPINIQSTNNQYGGSDGSKIQKFNETILHTISSLTLQWECSGGNNEPILGYCAFKYLYITVHYCKPYCSICTNEYDCSSWNSTYATANPKFSQADCLTSQYFHKDTSSCKSCPIECATCVSEQGCTSCTPTFVWSILGCVCLKNQYKENNQCINCPIQCSQCLSSSFCVECSNANYRYISNGQCVCYDGYYDVSGQAQCKVCSKLCLTCSGPSQNQCISCKTGKGLGLVSGSCQCPDGKYYDELSYICESCATNCKTCTSGKIGGQCTSCDTSNGWMLKELQCVCDNSHYQSGAICSPCPSVNMVSDGITCTCVSGYYQSGSDCFTCSTNEVIQGSGCVCAIGFYMPTTPSSVCTACPTPEDTTLTGCYKKCDSSTTVWHNVVCSSCDSGSSVVSGNCVVDPPVVSPQPVCGDLIVEGPEEECDDNNNTQDDGCHQCKFQCPQHCASCNSSTTLPCPDVCGDHMITGDEECEDANNLDEDGCYQCKFKCHHACTKCILGVCTECATSGYGLDNTVTPWSCKEKCGDKIVEGLEQCDDPTNPLCVKCRFCRIDCEDCDFTHAKCKTCATKGCEPYLNYCVNTCGDGYVVTDDFEYNTEECDDGNKVNYDGCSNVCKFQCQPIAICAYCVNERCLSCAKGYYLVESQNKCEPLCGDAIHVPQEICEDLLSPPYQCRRCKPFCQSNCKTCSIDGTGCEVCQKGYKKIDKVCYPICGDKFITVEEECDDGNITPGDGCHFCKYHCHDSCEVCLKGECYDCREGYYFLNYQCYPIINDGQVVSQSLNIFEYCDDGNTKQYDGCYENQFQCTENCEICHYGICDYCLPGYYLDDEGMCQTKCGDGILTLYTSEQCDDKNDIQYDGCYNCAFECAENCYYCNQVVCFKCEKGYRINDWLCDPVCGDKYIIPFIEECDDGNQILEDGCFDCKLLCCEGCSECVLGVCYDCLQGYEFDNQICLSICGDGIVVSKEKCDDANDEEFDGCFQCDYSCPLNCESCAQGKCIRCQDEYKFIDEFCVYYEPTIIVIDNNCGNGVIDKDEECDDGNSQPLDGCFVCYVEDNWICDQNSMCEYQQTPKMIVEYLNQTLSKQYVMIAFTQQIVLKGNQTLPGSLQYFIEDLDNDKYQLSPHIDYQNNTITLSIMIYTSLSDKPRLIVELIEDICNKNGQLIENTNAYSQLNIPKYVDDQIKEQAYNLQSANQLIMITSLCVASVSVALGDFEIFFETLSALQFQSLIKYINLDFPENLLIYFQSSEVITLKPFFSFFNLDTIIEEATFKKEPVKTQGKFGFYDEDADLFTSFLVQFLQSAFIVFVLLNESIVKKIVVFVINTHLYQKLLAYLYKKLGPKSPVRFQRIICSLPKFIYKFKQKINIYSFRRLLIVNAWDILLKSFLFLSAGQQFIDFRAILQTSLSIFVIGMYAVTIFHSFFPQADSVNKEFDRFQSCELIRVMLFSSVLTFIQTYQNIQLVVITMTNLVQLAFLISKRSIFEPPDFVSRVAVELSVALVMITSFVYFQDFSNLFSYDTKTKLGQAQIYMMMGGVGTVLGKMVYEKVKLIVNYLTKKPESKRPKNEILMNIVL